MSMLKELMLKDYVTLLGTVFGTSVIILSILGLIYTDIDYWIAFAALMWAGAMACDLLDGFVARKLNQSNEIGKQIDSLSDAVSFVVAPSILIMCASLNNEFSQIGPAIIPKECVMIGVFFLIFFGITRLAWFNVANVGEGYTGITTPMTAAFLISFYLSHHYFIQLNTFLPGYYNALVPVSYFFSNTLSVTLMLIILGFLNVATFLRYGKRVQKRRGIWKYLIFIFASFIVVAIIIGRGFMGTSIAKFVAHLIPLIFIVSLLGYYIYGFINYLRIKKRGELKKITPPSN
ncbi:MAG: CDP-alcohol phosphatidyltransferase family protein [Promethearchaeota archaeon]